MILHNFSLKQVILASFFAGLTAIGAFLIIPFYPVPMTLQTLFTLLSGMLLGKKAGFLSQLIYVSLGLIGLPVFSGGKAGFGVLFGPTGGYLIGFIISAYLIGFILEKMGKKQIYHYILAGSLGVIAIDLIGVAQLAIVMQITIQSAFVIGVFPFLVSDCIKIIAATLIASKLKLALKEML